MLFGLSLYVHYRYALTRSGNGAYRAGKAMVALSFSLFALITTVSAVSLKRPCIAYFPLLALDLGLFSFLLRRRCARGLGGRHRDLPCRFGRPDMDCAAGRVRTITHSYGYPIGRSLCINYGTLVLTHRVAGCSTVRYLELQALDNHPPYRNSCRRFTFVLDLHTRECLDLMNPRSCINNAMLLCSKIRRC